MKPYQDITYPALAKALAHPLRTRILAELEDRTASPSELATQLDVPLGVMSYHVRRLESLGFVELVERLPRRGAIEHYYRAKSRPRITSTAWGRTPAIVKEATVAAAVDQIGHYVEAAAADGGFNQADAHLTRSPVTVDEAGWAELAEELDAMLVRIKKIEAASKKRLARADHDGEQKATIVLMLFNSPLDPPAKPRSKQDSRSPAHGEHAAS